MANVTGSIKVSTTWQQSASGLPGTQTSALAVQQSPQFVVSTSGTSADSADLKYTKTITLAAAAQTLDLTSLTDVYGNAVNFAKVRSLTLVNKSTTNGQNLTVGNAASNAWTGFLGATAHTFIVAPSTASNQGMIVITAPNTAGFAVSGSSKNIKLDPGANTFDVDIEIVGTSV